MEIKNLVAHPYVKSVPGPQFPPNGHAEAEYSEAFRISFKLRIAKCVIGAVGEKEILFR